MTFLFWMLIDGVPAFMIEPVLWSEFAADDAERPWRRECQTSALQRSAPDTHPCSISLLIQGAKFGARGRAG